MVSSEFIGVNVIAPVLSTLTAGALLFTGRYFLKVGRILSNVEARVESNEQELEYVRKRINEIAEKTA